MLRGIVSQIYFNSGNPILHRCPMVVIHQRGPVIIIIVDASENILQEGFYHLFEPPASYAANRRNNFKMVCPALCAADGRKYLVLVCLVACEVLNHGGCLGGSEMLKRCRIP